MVNRKRFRLTYQKYCKMFKVISKFLLIFFGVIMTVNAQNVSEDDILVMKLKYGEVKIQMFEDVAPNHVKRIKELAEQANQIAEERANWEREQLEKAKRKEIEYQSQLAEIARKYEEEKKVSEKQARDEADESKKKLEEKMRKREQAELERAEREGDFKQQVAIL